MRNLATDGEPVGPTVGATNGHVELPPPAVGDETEVPALSQT